MSINYNPKIITDNLVFYYDQANVQKSWKGAPTTILLGTKSQDFTLWAPNATTVTPNAILAPDGTMTGALLTVNATGGSRSIAVNGVVPAGGNYSIYLKAAGATTSCSVGVYTASAWAGGGSASIISGPGSLSGSSSLYTISGLSYTDWTRVDVVSTLAGGALVYPKNTANTIGDSNYVANAQVEAGSICSAFTSSNRSNTQSLLDLTGNNIITANSLTYANDGSFSFNGTSDYLSIGNLGTFYPQGTISMWINAAVMASYNNPFRTDAGNVGIRFEENSLGNFVTAIGDDSGTFTPHTYITSGMLINTWYNIVLTWNVSINTVIGYLNSIQVFNDAQTNWPTNLASVRVGTGFTGGAGRSWNGKIPQVQIYNRALSQAEIQQNFNATRSRYGV